MKLDILLAPGSGSTGLATNASDAGFDTIWWVDSPAVFGDPFVAMAAAAATCKRSRLGVAVINPMTRPPFMAAASFASLNVIAEGGVAAGVGVGHTGTSGAGARKAHLAELEAYSRDLKSFMAGKGAPGEMAGPRFLNRGAPWFDFDRQIPLYVAAGGPRSLAVAARVADGILLGGVVDTGIIRRAQEIVGASAAQHGRQGQTIEICVTPSVHLSARAESFNEVRELLGPKSLGPALTFRRLAAEVHGADSKITRDLARIEAAYEQRNVPAAAGDQEERLGGYMTELAEWQRELVTPDLLELTSISGDAAAWRRHLAALADAGVDRVILSPIPALAPALIDGVARQFPDYLTS